MHKNRRIHPHFNHPPPWWPEDEQWPPRRSPASRRWHSARKSIIRRVGCAFVILFIAIFIIGGNLIADIIRRKAPPHMGTMMENVPIGVRIFSWLIFLIVIFGILYLIRFFQKAALPMVEMLEAAGKIADGDYNVRVPEHGPGDLISLSKAFNNMADKLHVNEEQRRMLLADISHELRTPLTIIQGNLEGMLDGIYPADPRMLQAVLDETHTMERIIEDLRTLTVVESGTLKLQMEMVDPTEFLEEIISTYQTLAEAKGIAFSTSIAPNLEKMEFDPTRIREVLSNIITNAIRYCQTGCKICMQCVQNSEYLEITITDSGSGIQEEDLPHIFERFYKGRDSSGSGLGLPIAKSLVEAHGGKISAQSEIDQGTTIRFTIPYTQ